MNDYTNVLLTSENRIKSVSPLSDNLAGKYLLPTIKIVQDIHLTDTIGKCLVRTLQEMIAEKTLDENEAYKDLLNTYIQPYLTYMVLSNLTDILANKLVNAGVMQMDDEHQNNSYRTDKNDLKLYYLRQADSYKRILQEFLLQNSKAFPELTDCECNRIRDNLHSAYSGGIWLGWSRGKMTPRSCKGC